MRMHHIFLPICLNSQAVSARMSSLDAEIILIGASAMKQHENIDVGHGVAYAFAVNL